MAKIKAKKNRSCPDRLYVTYHGAQRGQVFDTPEAAYVYPGPRGHEAAKKQVVMYVRADTLAALCRRLGKDCDKYLQVAARTLERAAARAARP